MQRGGVLVRTGLVVRGFAAELFPREPVVPAGLIVVASVSGDLRHRLLAVVPAGLCAIDDCYPPLTWSASNVSSLRDWCGGSVFPQPGSYNVLTVSAHFGRCY
jgi:hypothetical protein